jgi:hypothetical protein
MNRIHENTKFETLIVPVSMTAGATVTGTYKSLAGGMHDALFEVNFGALPATKKVTVEVFEADDASATNEAELVGAQTVYTSPSGGVTSGKVLVSVKLSEFSKEFATVKVTNDKDTALLGQAELILDMSLHGQDVNDDSASVVTVV